MHPLIKLFAPIRQAAAAFFRHDLALKRDAAGLQIVLEPKAPAPTRASKKKPSRQDLADRKDKQDVAVIIEQLGALLAEVPESRRALRQLVFVEQALQKKGLRALHKLPLEVLQRALEQFEGLVTNWSQVGLASLRSRMAVTIIDREHQDPVEAENDAYRTATVLDHEPTPPPAAEEYKDLFLDDDDALAKAYAALGSVAPSGEVEFQGELGSRSAKAVAPPLPRVNETAGHIQLREVEA